jgi:hypothetical protein
MRERERSEYRVLCGYQIDVIVTSATKRDQSYSSSFKIWQNRAVELVIYKSTDRITTFRQKKSVGPQVNVVIEKSVRPIERGVRDRRRRKEFAIVGSGTENRYLHLSFF